MTFVNNYEMVDVERAYDMRAGEYKPNLRMYIDKGTEADAEPDYGHCKRNVFDTKTLTMMRIPSAPGLKSPAKPGYVYHPGQAEIEYCLFGERHLKYPDGKDFYLHPGSVFMHSADQPHAMEGLSVGKSGVLCFHSANIKDVGRALWPFGKHYEVENGYAVVHCPEAPVSELSPKGIKAKLICHTWKMCMVDVSIESGVSTPVQHFIKNNVDQIVFVVSGRGMFVYPDKAYCVHEEMSCYNHAGQPYRFVNTGNEDLHLVCVYAAENFADIKRTEVRVSDLA